MNRSGIYVGLGSNLGDRRGYLNAAVEALNDEGVITVKRSSLYETEPQDVENQPWFLNQVIEVETKLFPLQLLRTLQKIEHELGRSRGMKPARGPRTIDLDLLLFGNKEIGTPDLEVPHPRLLLRRFVLEPLVEIAPNLRHPVTRQALWDSLQRVKDQKVRRVA